MHAFRTTLSLLRLLSTMLLSKAHCAALQQERAVIKAAIEARATAAFAPTDRIIERTDKRTASIDEANPEEKFI